MAIVVVVVKEEEENKQSMKQRRNIAQIIAMLFATIARQVAAAERRNAEKKWPVGTDTQTHTL